MAKNVSNGVGKSMKIETKEKLNFKLTKEDKAGDLFLLVIDLEDGQNKILLWMVTAELEKLKEVLNI